MIPHAQGHTFKAYPINSSIRRSFAFAFFYFFLLSFTPTFLRLLVHLNRDWGNKRQGSKQSDFLPGLVLATPIPDQTRPVANKDQAFLLGGKTAEARLELMTW